ncbi:MAG: DUF3857 domain-containing protein [Balneolales bacterium]|nr:DUF3857 domain-containing protein [Balneolales bacterium]
MSYSGLPLNTIESYASETLKTSKKSSDLPANALPYDFRRIPVDLMVDADAVVRNDSRTFTMHRYLSGTFEVIRSVTILSQSGLEHAKFKFIEDSFSEIDFVRARIFDRFGNETGTANFSDFNSTDSGTGFTEYEALLRGPAFPFTVEVRYQISYSSFMQFPVWMPAGNAVSIEQAEFTIAVPTSEDISYRAFHTEALNPRETRTAQQQRFYWSLQSFYRIRRESNAPSVEELVPRLFSFPNRFLMHNKEGSAQNPESFGKWIQSVQKGRHHLSPEDMELARELRPILPEYQFLYDMLINLEDLRQIRPLIPRPLQLPDTRSLFDFLSKSDENGLKALKPLPDRWELELYWLNREAALRKIAESALKETEISDTEESLASNMEVFQTITDRIFTAIEYRPESLLHTGFLPKMPIDTFNDGFGNANDITYYLRTLLQFARIPAWQAFINTDAQGTSLVTNTDPELHSAFFNHVLLVAVVDADTLWLDPAAQISGFPPAYPGYAASNRPALLVDRNTISMTSTKRLDADENRLVRQATTRILENGHAQSTIETTFYGQQHEFIRHLSQQEESMQQQLLYQRLAIPNYDFREIEVIPNDYSDSAQLHLELDIRGFGVTAAAGNRILFRPNLLERRSSSITALEPRTQPIYINYGYTDEEHLRYILPQGFRIARLPDNVEIQFPLGSYKVSYLPLEDGTLMFRRFIRIESGVIPVEKYGEYIRFMNHVYRIDQEQVILERR